MTTHPIRPVSRETSATVRERGLRRKEVLDGACCDCAAVKQRVASERAGKGRSGGG